MHHPAPSSPLNLNLEASSSPPPPPSSSSSPVSARRRWSWLGRGLPCFAIGALLLAFVFLFQFSGLELSMDLQHMKDWLMAKQTKDSDSADPSPRIAICLVGGAREFELTGPSIRKYLLNQDLLHQADVFLHSPLDKDTYKLSLLAGGDLRAINLVHFRIIKPEPILESKTYTDVLTGSGSPHGVQVFIHSASQSFHSAINLLNLANCKSYERSRIVFFDWFVCMCMRILQTDRHITHTRMHACMHAYRQAHKTHIHPLMHACIHPHIHLYMYVCVHVCNVCIVRVCVCLLCMYIIYYVCMYVCMYNVCVCVCIMFVCRYA